MKNLLLILLFPLFVLAQENTIILDQNFEQALIDLGYDDTLDNSVLTANINTITMLDISGKNIVDLTGIEDFDSLIYLYCYSNYLNELDISNNLILEHLYCGNNNLSELDVSNNTLLTYLSCDNNELTELDISNNPLLSSLICFDANLLALDVSNNTMLTYLSCDNNDLVELDVSNNSLLSFLNCFNNNLSELDISNNLELTNLYCYSNNLSELDISNNTNLNQLHCASNNLSTLNTSYNTGLTYLNCSWNSISDLNLSNNMNLNRLSCYGNNLSELDVSNNTELTALYCYQNNLSELDVSNNTELTDLWCYENNIDCLQVWDVEYALEQENCPSDQACFIKDDDAIWSLNCSCSEGYTLLTLMWTNGLNTGFSVSGEINGFLYSEILSLDDGYLTQCWLTDLQEDCFMIDITADEDFEWQLYAGDILILEGGSEDIFFGSQCITGCTEDAACNYNNLANTDDQSCLFPGDDCLLLDGGYGSLDENCDCIDNTSLLDSNQLSRKVIAIIDVLGRRVEHSDLRDVDVLFYIFDDGHIEKHYTLK